MAFLDLMPSGKRMTFGFDAEKAFRVPIGAASPLWLAFAGVAGVGVGFWWLTRLMKPMAALALKQAPVAPMAMLAAPEPVIEAVAEMIAPEPIADAVTEMVAPEPVVEAVVQTAAEPIASEAVEPTMETDAEPAARVEAAIEAPAEPSFPITEAMMAGVDAIADPVETPAAAPMVKATTKPALSGASKAIAARRKRPKKVSAKLPPKTSI